MQRISVRVDDRLKEQLDATAREQGVRPSDVVRRLLQEHLPDQAPQLNAKQLAEKLGLIGCVSGLPMDLSTNPIYMEGFGENSNLD